MILVIDNYDSFTFNLVQYIRGMGKEVVVIRNNHLSIQTIEELNPESILLSPGPGNPDSAGICLEVVKAYYQKIPILGVCLGQQIIAQAFGGVVKKAIKPMHGKTSEIRHDENGVFFDLPTPLQVARYHSLVVDEKRLPSCLDITAKSEDGEIMGIRHKDYPVEGVQFHPEAILTEYGYEMLENFFEKAKGYRNYESKRASLIV